jgi:hypothetical protein
LRSEQLAELAEHCLLAGLWRLGAELASLLAFDESE